VLTLWHKHIIKCTVQSFCESDFNKSYTVNNLRALHRPNKLDMLSTGPGSLKK